MASDAVQQIKDRLDIVEVLSPYVELKPAGKSLKGKSPFTAEKTPSFYVSPERGMYYCFSTNQGGDIFTFVQAMEGVDFKGALKILADKAGVELVREDPQKRTERDNQYAALEAATEFYESEFRTAKEATTYVKDRGITGLTAKQWRIGYAPNEWRAAKEALEGQNITTNTLRTVALLKGEANKEPYDVFRDRIMFPICDPSGRVIGFSGRLLHPDDKAPKYLNSPESPLFKKSEALFGYHRAKEGMRKMDFSLIVEGQFDVVLAHQAGYANTVAVSGTALTNQHVALLQRLSNRCVLALDADRAGIAAVKKAATVMLARGMDVKVARLPDGEDPADIISQDVERFKYYIGTATHVIEFLLAVYKEQTKDDRTFKLQVREAVLPYVQLIPNHIDQEHFLGVIAEALAVEKMAVRLELTRLAESAALTQQPQEVKVKAAEPVAVASTQSRQTAVQVYLQAVYPLLDKNLQPVVAERYQAITEEAITDIAHTAEAVNQASFQLEEQLSRYSPLQIKEELAQSLEEFRQKRLKTRLRELSTELASDQAQGRTHEDATLSSINQLKQALVDDTITIEVFE